MDRQQAKVDPKTGDLPLSITSRIPFWVNMVWIGVMIWASFGYLGVNVVQLVMDLPGFFGFFFGNFLPPNYQNLNRYLPFILETIYFAVVGTYISAILSFLLGLLMSKKYSPIPGARFLGMVIASVFRNVPFLVWASLLIFIFGIGNMVGLIAISIVTLGFLSRSYAVSFDQISSSKLEGLKATGAGYLQILVHGIIPEFIPSWLNWTLFTFEINIRASAVLGMVGAGGMGIMIQTNLRHFRYRESMSLIIILVAMVLLTELITGKLRKLIR